MATSQMVEANRKGWAANSTLSIYRRVVLSGGKLSYAAATEMEVGTLMQAAVDTTALNQVQLRTANGTAKFVASGAITSGAAVYAAANGKVSATGTLFIGTALQSAAADNDVLEVLRGDDPKNHVAVGTVAATGSTQGDAAALAAGFNWVTAADATKGVVLPTGETGLVVTVKNDDTANAILKVYPPTGGKINALSTNAAISMAAVTSATFYCYDGTQWFTVPKVPS